jgi:DNA polymerase III epsilon subunit-like protein
MKDFIVVDTEGYPELTEIAILDSQGSLIYQAFVENEFNSEERKINVKSLKTIVEDFTKFAKYKAIICHYAEHDSEVLKNSFDKVSVSWTNFDFVCSYELAKKYFKLDGYSLEYLSKHFKLKVNNKYFNSDFAHGAQYDAQFTYQLYLKIMLENKPNPFGSSRVDTVFQNHPDLKTIYQDEFEILKSIVSEIKADPNHQSRGAVVLGKAGSGKTHLMMRLAKDLLKSNRLLFIRQPNHPNAVLYHTYSRILESFLEIIPDSPYSQLEYLLAQSFSRIMIDILQKKDKLTKNGEKILNELLKDALNIYSFLGGENTETKRRNWQVIEKETLAWWAKKYGFSGYSASIIKGLIKFCRYSDPHRRELVRKWLSAKQLESSELEKINLENWGDDISQEDFSLEAIGVFSKLSIIDEPLIIIFDQLEGLKYNEELLLNFGEALKELFTYAPNSLIILNLFPDRWEYFKNIFNDAIIDRISQYEVSLGGITNHQLQQILELKAEINDIDIKTIFTPDDLKVILSQSSIRSVLNWASHYYRHKIEGIALPKNMLSFEEEIRIEIRTINDDISWLKQQIQRADATIISDNSSNYKTNVKQIDTAIKGYEQQVQDYLVQQQELFEQTYHRNMIISDSDDIGKIITISEVFKTFKVLETDVLRMGKKKLPEHLLIKTKDKSFVVAFLQASGRSFTARIQNFNQLVLYHKNIRFRLFRDVRESKITAKVGKAEIEKLNNTSNGSFMYLEKADRINLEIVYKMVVDIQNKDFEIPLQEALQALESLMSDYWLVQIFKLSKRKV